MRCPQPLTMAIAQIVASVLCGGLAMPVIAEAKVRPLPTQIVLTEGTSNSIIGTVSSQDKQCVRDRIARLLELSTGAAFHTLTADRGGRFSIALSDIPPGSSGFRVQAEPARAGNRDCEAASVDVAADFVTLSGGPHDGAFTGVLNSSVPACEPGRVIELWDVGSEPVFTGFDFADANGAWRISQATGTYEARANPIFARTNGTFTYCRAVASFPWTFEDPPEE